MKINMAALSNMLGIDVRGYKVENSNPNDGKIVIFKKKLDSKRKPAGKDWFELSGSSKPRFCQRAPVLMNFTGRAKAIYSEGFCKEVVNPTNLNTKRIKIIMAALGEKLDAKFMRANKAEIARARRKLFARSKVPIGKRLPRFATGSTCIRFKHLQTIVNKLVVNNTFWLSRTKTCSLPTGVATATLKVRRP